MYRLGLEFHGYRVSIAGGGEDLFALSATWFPTR
jgi:hypothetical protein